MPPLFYMQKANFGFAAHHSFAAVLKYILNKKKSVLKMNTDFSSYKAH